MLTRAGDNQETTRASAAEASGGTEPSRRSSRPWARAQARISGASWLPGTSTTSRSAPIRRPMSRTAGSAAVSDRCGWRFIELRQIAEHDQAVDVLQRLQQPGARRGETQPRRDEPGCPGADLR